METPSDGLETEQVSKSIDLAEIANSHPVNTQTAVLNLNTFDATQLTLLEVLDMADAAGVPPEAMGALIGSSMQTGKRMRLLFAMAWCIARRANPYLTFEEVCTWRLEVIGEVTPEHTEKVKQRAKVVVGAAQATGLSPTEASKLTIAELSEYQDRNKQRRRRRAG